MIKARLTCDLRTLAWTVEPFIALHNILAASGTVTSQWALHVPRASITFLEVFIVNTDVFFTFLSVLLVNENWSIVKTLSKTVDTFRAFDTILNFYSAESRLVIAFRAWSGRL